ncbi:MAG: alpha/beta fold hydrolase [Negativicutes bacterium]|nr:alpha/beta fold hydrolase [Negativicutes bacterium]
MSRDAIELAGGKAGVVLIHGLTGSPFELKYLAGQLNRAGFSVKVPCLAGHGGAIEELKKTTWRDWYGTVQQTIAEMRKTCSELFVGGLCMGAVLALHAAHEYGGIIKAVAAMSSTFRFDGWSLPWYSFLMPLNHYTPIRYLYSYPEGEPYGIKNERLRRSVARGLKDNSLAYDCVPGVSMYQLHKLAGVVIPELPAITAPTVILHSLEDDTASSKNADLLERRIGSRDVRRVVLDNCYHMITIDNQRELVAQEVTAFFTKFTTGTAKVHAG